MSFDLRNSISGNVQPGDDTYSDQALAQAEDLVQKFGKDICIQATVDRFDGLVLAFVQPNATKRAGWHFNTAICGYNGAGPKTSARILALFGFGSYDTILDRISKGGDDANFEFTK